MFRLVKSAASTLNRQFGSKIQNPVMRAFSTEHESVMGIFQLSAGRESIVPYNEENPIVDFHYGGKGDRMLAVDESGTLLVKGNAPKGYFGLGDVEHLEEWTPVEGLPPVATARFADQHMVALTQDGDVYTWGNGGSFFKPGALGHGDNQSLNRPKRVAALSNVKKIATGQKHTLALDDEGKVFSWGLGEYGRLGHGSSSSYSEPAVIEALLSLDVNHIDCGNSFSAAATNEGIFTWGKNDRGQLGLKPGMLFEMYNMEAIPTPVQFPDEPSVNEVPSTVDVVSCGPRSCFAYRSETGELYFWGDKIWNVPTKIEIEGITLPIKGFAHSKAQSVILDSGGNLFMFVRNLGIKRLGEPAVYQESRVGKIHAMFSGDKIAYLLKTVPEVDSSV